MMKLICGVLIGLLLSACTSWGKKQHAFTSEGQELEAKTVLSGRNVIWGFDFFENGDVLFTEKSGSMYRFNRKTQEVKKIKGLPAIALFGQGGLLDVRLHPEFKKNQWVYFSYAHRESGGVTTRVARAKLKGDQLTQLNVLFTALPLKNTGHHFGSRIVFDRKGHIFFSVGDRGARALAQMMNYHPGKILRLKEDGSIPKDNPFVGQKNIQPEIWSYGHRNPQGMYFDHKTGVLFAEEHGPQGGDEINIVKKGKNYGWPEITYGKEYGSGADIGDGPTRKDVVPPLKYFVPSIAPGGFAVYRGEEIPEWDGHLLSTALKLRHLNVIPYKNGKIGSEQRLLKEMNQRFRAIRTAPDGSLWLSTDSGRLVRVARAK